MEVGCNDRLISCGAIFSRIAFYLFLESDWQLASATSLLVHLHFLSDDSDFTVSSESSSDDFTFGFEDASFCSSKSSATLLFAHHTFFAFLDNFSIVCCFSKSDDDDCIVSSESDDDDCMFGFEDANSHDGAVSSDGDEVSSSLSSLS